MSVLIPRYPLSVLHRPMERNTLYPMPGLFSVDTAHVSAGSYIFILHLFTISHYTYDKFSIIIMTFHISYITHFLLLGIHVPFRGIFLIQVCMSAFFFLSMFEFRSCPPWLRTKTHPIVRPFVFTQILWFMPLIMKHSCFINLLIYFVIIESLTGPVLLYFPYLTT